MIDVLGISAQAQAVAEALMVDTCIARRPTGTQTVNQSTGAVTETFTDLFTSACRLRPGLKRPPPGTTIGEQEVVVADAILQLPVARDALRVNDVVEILTSQSPGLVGRKLRVMNPHMVTSASAARYYVQESTIPDMAATP